MHRLILSFFLVALTSTFVSGQTTQDIKKALPVLDKWVMTPTIESFDEETLFERINGGAENFLLFDFKEMLAIEYKKGESYISMQIYRHGSPEMAFGVYSAERSPDLNYIPIGTEGYQEGTVLNFLTGGLYVKMESPFEEVEVTDAILALAQKFCANLKAPGKFPALLSCFPVQDKLLQSEQFITTSYLGLSFLNNALITTYTKGEDNYKLFLITGENPGNAKEMLTKYFEFTKQDISTLKEGRLTMNDPYNGTIELQWKGKYISGLINDSKISLPIGQLLSQLIECATK